MSLDSLSPGIGATSGTSGFSYVIYYLISAVVFSGLILILARKNLARVLKWVFIAVIAYIVFYIWSILGIFIAQNYPEYYAISFGAPAIMVVLLVFKNEWYVVDTAGFFLAAGVASIWGLVIGVWAAVVFLAAFALYDYIAVYKTRHMIGLASIAFNEKLPMLFVFPSQKGVKLDSIKIGETESHDNKALLLGFGDIVFPCIMVVSSAMYGKANFLPFMLFPMIGGIAGMLILFFTNVSRPAPGLPYINTGSVAGFLAAFLIFRIF